MNFFETVFRIACGNNLTSADLKALPLQVWSFSLIIFRKSDRVPFVHDFRINRRLGAFRMRDIVIGPSRNHCILRTKTAQNAIDPDIMFIKEYIYRQFICTFLSLNKTGTAQGEGLFFAVLCDHGQGICSLLFTVLRSAGLFLLSQGCKSTH